jgi:hypothetical protein
LNTKKQDPHALAADLVEANKAHYHLIELLFRKKFKNTIATEAWSKTLIQILLAVCKSLTSIMTAHMKIIK